MAGRFTDNQGSGGRFYVDQNETIIDPYIPATMTVQTQLSVELQRYDDLVQRDYRYARIVAGASKMPMNMIWSSREDDAVSDTDLAALKDIAWGEFIKKRYLPGVPATTSVQTATASMLEIVRDMNLQRRRFAIMGLHEQVEASELQLILHLCQADLIRCDNYRVMANRYRRHDQLFEAFGLAVGAFVCSSAPYTLGSGTGRYERDLQFEYKKQTTALFIWALRKVRDVIGFEDDYVARLSKMIVVRPGGDRVVGFRGGGGGDDDDSQKRNNQALLDAVVEAQRNAEAALVKSIKNEESVLGLGRTIESTKESISKDIEHKEELLTSQLERWKAEAVLGVLSGGVKELEQRNEILIKTILDRAKAEVDARINVSLGDFDAKKAQFEQHINTIRTDIARETETAKREMADVKGRIDALNGSIAVMQNTVIGSGDVEAGKVAAVIASKTAELDQRVENLFGIKSNQIDARMALTNAEIATTLADNLLKIEAKAQEQAAGLDATITATAARICAERLNDAAITKLVSDKFDEKLPGMKDQIMAIADTNINDAERRITKSIEDGKLKEHIEQNKLDMEHMKEEITGQMEADIIERINAFEKRIDLKISQETEEISGDLDSSLIQKLAEIEAARAKVDNTIADFERKIDDVESEFDRQIDEAVKTINARPDETVRAQVDQLVTTYMTDERIQQILQPDLRRALSDADADALNRRIAVLEGLNSIEPDDEIYKVQPPTASQLSFKRRRPELGDDDEDEAGRRVVTPRSDAGSSAGVSPRPGSAASSPGGRGRPQSAGPVTRGRGRGQRPASAGARP